MLVGVGLAWLTSVCAFPGRNFFEWALMLPLAIPTYVMAFVFLGLMSYTGPVQTALRSWFGNEVYFPNVQASVRCNSGVKFSACTPMFICSHEAPF